MKKRLRKKLGVGEFQDFGFWMLINFREGTSEEAIDKVANEFIDMLEENGMRSIVSGEPHLKALIFMDWKRSVVADWQMDIIKPWLEGCEEIEGCEISEPVDVRRDGWPITWPEDESDDILYILATGAADHYLTYNRKHPGNTVHDWVKANKGWDPLAYPEGANLTKAFEREL